MLTAALELGGHHASTGLVGLTSPTVKLHDQQRVAVDSRAPLSELLASLGHVCASLITPGRRWAIALPGPFDYVNGRGGRHTDGKYNAFNGVDLRALLSERWSASHISFCNDADAFGAGAWLYHGMPQRLFAMTLGTGIGSAFITDGRPTQDAALPSELYCETLADGRSLEDTFGPQSVVDRHNLHNPARTVGSFRELADLARQDAAVSDAVATTMSGLADAIAPWLLRFRPETVVFGGSVCRAWDVFGAGITARIGAALGPDVPVRVMSDTETLSLVGATSLGAG